MHQRRTILLVIVLSLFIQDVISQEESQEDSSSLETKQLNFGVFFLNQEILRDFSFNALNFVLNWVGVLVHQVFLQVFKIY